MLPVRKVLLLASNPLNTPQLRLDQEVRTIKHAIQLSNNSKKFDVIPELAVQIEDLLPQLSLHKPEIVHFLGHGSEHQGLVLDNGKGGTQTLSARSLVNVLAQFNSVECVLLNTCYSDKQAKVISDIIPYVIGMNSAIKDSTAIAFSSGFYTGLADERSYEAAYEMGLAAIGSYDSLEEGIPVWRQRCGELSSQQKLNIRSVGSGETEQTKSTSSNVSSEDSRKATVVQNLLCSSQTSSVNENTQFQSHPQAAIKELSREPGGAVRLASELYVKRSNIEVNYFSEIEEPGSLIRVKAPREMGKTSLLIRIADHARKQGYKAVIINFQRADSKIFSDFDLLLRWICMQVGRALSKVEEFKACWESELESKDKCNIYFEQYLLCGAEIPLVVGFDEVDLLFSHPPTAEAFFSLLRYWYDLARIGDELSALWENLRLIVTYSTESYLLLDDEKLAMTLDPTFTVGTNVKLTDFSIDQIQDLAQRHGFSRSVAFAEGLMSLIGGHPHLVRKALYHLYQNNLTVDSFKETAATEEGIYGEHLLRHLYFLREYPKLRQEFLKVVRKEKGTPVEIDSDASFKLESMGLILRNRNLAFPRCEIYRQYFRERLGV